MRYTEEDNKVGAFGAVIVFVGILSFVLSALFLYIPPIKASMAPHGSYMYHKYADGFWFMPVVGIAGVVCGLIARFQRAKVWSKIPIIGGIGLLSAFLILYLVAGPP